MCKNEQIQKEIIVVHSNNNIIRLIKTDYLSLIRQSVKRVKSTFLKDIAFLIT